MMVQASGMIGANSKFSSPHSSYGKADSSVYQASDAPRYFKANKGLIGLIVFNVVSLKKTHLSVQIIADIARF
jgi:hypothetical protein